MTETVSVLSILFMGISCAIGFAIPIVLFFYFRKRKNAEILPFFIGCAVMLVFALILEAAVHRVVLASEIGSKIKNQLWLYALYGGLMAGLFEETGRWIAFKTILKRYQDHDSNALMYGAGHGGFESAVLLGVAMINNIIYSVMIRAGNADALTSQLSGDTLTQVQTAIQTLITTPSYQFLLGGVERIFAVTLQISLSVLVWFAAKTPGKGFLFPLAILFHCLVDAITVLLAGYNVPILLVELVIVVMAVAVLCLARIVWRKNAS